MGVDYRHIMQVFTQGKENVEDCPEALTCITSLYVSFAKSNEK